MQTLKQVFAWYQDNQGNTSAMRIIVVPAGILGMLTVAAGVVAMFLQLQDAAVALTVGAGMIATAQGAKAFQKKYEGPGK